MFVLQVLLAGGIWFLYLLFVSKKIKVAEEYEDKVHIVLLLLLTILAVLFFGYIFPSLRASIFDFIQNTVIIFSLSQTWFAVGKLTGWNNIAEWLKKKEEEKKTDEQK
jgi:hypothetical protein